MMPNRRMLTPEDHRVLTSWARGVLIVYGALAQRESLWGW
jgi:hypothetical protein